MKNCIDHGNLAQLISSSFLPCRFFLGLSSSLLYRKSKWRTEKYIIQSCSIILLYLQTYNPCTNEDGNVSMCLHGSFVAIINISVPRVEYTERMALPCELLGQHWPSMILCGLILCEVGYSSPFQIIVIAFILELINWAVWYDADRITVKSSAPHCVPYLMKI